MLNVASVPGQVLLLSNTGELWTLRPTSLSGTLLQPDAPTNLQLVSAPFPLHASRIVVRRSRDPANLRNQTGQIDGTTPLSQLFPGCVVCATT